MSRETKTPSVPDIRDDNVLEVLRALKMISDLREGDGLDSFATMRDLTDLNLATEGESDGSGGNTIPVSPIGGGPGTDGYDPGTDTTIPPAPTGLTGAGAYLAIYLSWNGANYRNHAYTEVWRSATDLLGDPGPPGSAGSEGGAILVGTSAGNLFTDVVGPEQTYYYWIRFVSKANIAGPFNSTSGTPVTSSFRVGDFLPGLADDIGNTELFRELQRRISQIEVDAIVANRGLISELSVLAARVNNNVSRILELHTVTETQAIKLESVSTTGSGAGNAVYFSTERPDAATPGFVSGVALSAGDLWYDSNDSNKSYRWTGSAWLFFYTGVKVYHQNENPSLSAGGGNNGSGGIWQDSTGRQFITGDLWYDANDNNKPYRWSGSAFVLIADTTATASITDLAQTKVGYATLNVRSRYGPQGAVFDDNGSIWNNALSTDTVAYPNSVRRWNSAHVDSPDIANDPPSPTSDSTLVWHIGLPFAQATKQVAITADGGANWYTLQQQFTALKKTDGELLLQYTLKLDSAGYVSGFGLANTTPIAGPTTSLFMVNADRFAIGPPTPAATWNGTTPYALYELVKYTKIVDGISVIHTFQSTHATNSGNTPVWGATKAEDVAPATLHWIDLHAKLPFVVTTSGKTIGGKFYPPGVWMDTVNIASATIDDAQIIELRANKITTGTLTASIGITTGKIYWGVNPDLPIDPTVAGGGTQSGFFLGDNGGTTKFFIGNPQNFVYWNGTQFEVRGKIIGTSGTIGGINMGRLNVPQTAAIYAPASVTGWASGAGFYADETGRWRVGNPAPGGKGIAWDGNNLTITADMSAFGGTFNTLTFNPSFTNPNLWYGATWYPASGARGGALDNGFILGYNTAKGVVNFFLGRSDGSGTNAGERYLWYDGLNLLLKGDLVASGNIVNEGVTATRSAFYTTLTPGPKTDFEIINLVFTCALDASVVMAFTARHSYTGSGDESHKFRFFMDGTEFLGDVTLQGESDYVAIGYNWDGSAGRSKLLAGPRTLRVLWSGGSGNVTLKRALATIQMMYK